MLKQEIPREVVECKMKRTVVHFKHSEVVAMSH